MFKVIIMKPKRKLIVKQIVSLIVNTQFKLICKKHIVHEFYE